MRRLAAFCLIILTTAVLSHALAGEAETIDPINAFSNALDKAFERNDMAAIKALMTPDHISSRRITTVRKRPMIRLPHCPS